MDTLLFILGAGFNKDARGEVGPIKGHHFYYGEYEIDVDYPLVDELTNICFGNEKLNNGVSLEEQISRAISTGNYEPLKNLYEEIMKADYYLVPKLLPSNDKPFSCYAKFFSRFKTSSFLTFNYDSLADLFLLKLKRWHPIDGFGVPVMAELELNKQDEVSKASSASLVLHLHGSLCIYTVEFEMKSRPRSHIKWITPKDHPDFIFDPDSITDLFFPYTRVPPIIGGYTPIERRVIAPVPDKMEGLKAIFTHQVHSKAKKLLEGADTLVSIGYSFNPIDKSSYEHLIQHFTAYGDRKVVIIALNASDIVRQLKKLYRSIEWIPISNTFKQWVEGGFFGIDI